MKLNQKQLRRFMAKFHRENECWIWHAAKDTNGYGQFSLDGKGHRPHRVGYEHFVGAIPVGRQLDHLCRNRACVNPRHLEPVTGAENIRRGDTGKIHADKPCCPQGHAYDTANTYHWQGQRACRTCRGARQRTPAGRAAALGYKRRYRDKKKALAIS